MSAPIEFSEAYVEAHSSPETQPYRAFLTSGEPYRSLMRRAFHTGARLGFAHDPSDAPGASPRPGLDLEDEGLYYNTTGAAADYWQDIDLPRPAKDIRRLREDLDKWGYCLIEEALSAAQLTAMKRRVIG